MSIRGETLQTIVRAIGDAVTVTEPGNGWPATVTIRVADGLVPVALHVGTLALSHRDRDDVERRFQNPGQGKPVLSPTGSTPLLIGLWNEPPHKPVLVAMDAYRRVGRDTRQSLFIPLQVLEAASRNGWAEHVSGSGERIFVFQPGLFPAYFETVRKGVTDLDLETDMTTVLDAAGLTSEHVDASSIERARRAAMIIVRDRAFSKHVLDAYDQLCAMCGLNLGLVQGAHIYPVQAPNSPDQTWNGLALCGNHHQAFDRHMIWVDPGSRDIRVDPRVHRAGERSRNFIESTYPTLTLPKVGANHPRPGMFRQRYEFFGERYNWVTQ